MAFPLTTLAVLRVGPAELHPAELHRCFGCAGPDGHVEPWELGSWLMVLLPLQTGACSDSCW